MGEKVAEFRVQICKFLPLLGLLVRLSILTYSTSSVKKCLDEPFSLFIHMVLVMRRYFDCGRRVLMMRFSSRRSSGIRTRRRERRTDGRTDGRDGRDGREGCEPPASRDDDRGCGVRSDDA